MDDKKIKEMVYTSLLAALVCVATFIIKVPSPVTGGYTHLGDGFIFLGVILLGKRNGAWAGAIGASLADFIGGYSFYVIPTFIIKAIMALIMGSVIERLPTRMKNRWIGGALLGSVWQIGAYYVVGSLIVGNFLSTISEIPGNIVQSAIGIIVSAAFLAVFKNTPTGKRLLEI
ncbi:MAG TPA: ECF transporter S component [Tissierellia bacterium]|nr:ECF transporter S component [Tissierellia bacterium]